MPRPTWPDPIYRAFFEAWIDECEMPDEMWDGRVDAFATRWGRLDADAFLHALRFGDESERLCALFALGYLAVPDVEALLEPFLYSPIRKERWASAIGLGESRNEQAFVLLLELLSETMEYHPPHRSLDLGRIVFDAAREARDRLGSSDAWDQILAPSLVQAWREEQAYHSEYEWYTIHRLTIARLLGEWGDPRAIPVLRQALRACWDLEQRSRSQGGRARGSLQGCYGLERDLAYALGQLEAWDALEGLGLPPADFHVARLYLVLGSLRANVHSLSLYGGDILRLISLGTDAAGELWRRQRRADVRRIGRRADESAFDEPESQAANARPYPRKRRLKGWPVVSGTIDPGPVLTVLQERYGLNEREGRAELQRFQLWHQERAGRRGQISSPRETIDETIICYQIMEKCRRQHWYGPDMLAPRWLLSKETGLLQMPTAWTFADAPLTEEHLQSAERRLGFALPSLLWAIYTRVANGGFGPGYGLNPLEILANSYFRNGADRFVDFHLLEKQADDKKLILMPHDVWPEGFLCLCHWGCTGFSYLELATGRVFRQDYYVGEQYGFEVEAPTLEAWFEGWLAEDVDLENKSRYGIGIVRLPE